MIGYLNVIYFKYINAGTTFKQQVNERKQEGMDLRNGLKRAKQIEI